MQKKEAQHGGKNSHHWMYNCIWQEPQTMANTIRWLMSRVIGILPTQDYQ